MRKRLIDLLVDFDENQCKRSGVCEEEQMADYLLANGVIVPPVNVGQTVWIAYEDNGEWTMDEVTVSELYISDREFGCHCYHSDGWWTSFSTVHLGKTVFLTKEEAEAALERLINEERH